MDSENSFYVTLPSNTNQYDTNTLNNFRVRLPQRLELSGPAWEVALVEAIYPHNWNNVERINGLGLGDYEFDYDLVLDIHFPSADDPKALINGNVSAYVPSGAYQSPFDLARAINKCLQVASKAAFDPEKSSHIHWPRDINKVAYMDYSEINKRMILRVFRPDIFKHLTLSGSLSYILGFGTYVISIGNPDFWIKQENGSMTMLARHPIDMRAGLYALYIYCNIVERQIVGDALVPLLAKMPVSGEHDSIVHQVFNPPLYVPIVRNSIDTIEIDIKDDTNRGIKFQYGKVILTLHFRRRKTRI
jgi:hypothetical protein